MDLRKRIRRRRSDGRSESLVANPGPLSPTVHLSEPVGRGSELERLLDHLDPVFDGTLPEPLSIYGPRGVGTSAIVTALFAALDAEVGSSRRAIATTTRSARRRNVRFLYVDARSADSEYRFYHSLLDSLEDDHVPEQGVGTERLRERLGVVLSDQNAVVAVDHVDEPGEVTPDRVDDLLAPFDPHVTHWTVGHDAHHGRTPAIEIGPNPTHGLVDVLTERASQGLSNSIGLEHRNARRIAEWADGNAHDALAVLLSAALAADDAGASRIRDEDLDCAIESVPRGGVHLARVLALPENRRRLLAEFADRGLAGSTVAEATSALETHTDLADGTITRFLYELANDGILERVGGGGRSASRLEPQFSTRVFGYLYEMDREGP